MSQVSRRLPTLGARFAFVVDEAAEVKLHLGVTVPVISILRGLTNDQQRTCHPKLTTQYFGFLVCCETGSFETVASR